MSEKRPFFSIVIPTYNRAEQLGKALESIGRQTFRDFEVIICDDGSTDGTQEVVSAFNELLPVVYHWESNWGGPARPRNIGIKLARGSWVCFLDADDWWHPDKLAAIFSATADHDVIYHDVQSYFSNGKKAKNINCRQLKAPIAVDLLSCGNPIATSSVCIRKELLEESGGFAEEKALIAVEDFDLWVRLSYRTEKFYYLKKCLGGYLVSEDSISGPVDTYRSRHDALLSRHKHNLNGACRKEVDAYWSYCFGVKAESMGHYSESRELFINALQSHRIKIIIKAIVHVLYSYYAQFSRGFVIKPH